MSNISNVHNFKMQRWLEHAGNIYRNAIARPGEIKLENHAGEASELNMELVRAHFKSAQDIQYFKCTQL
jgi:hypothetical protein